MRIPALIIAAVALACTSAAAALAERSRRLTLDLPGHYQLHPGTVFYLGYGSALEGETSRALRTNRARVFVKLSYLWQV